MTAIRNVPVHHQIARGMEQRKKLLEWAKTQPQPWSRADAAAALGVSEAGASQHIGRLVEEGACAVVQVAAPLGSRRGSAPALYRVAT